MQKVLMNNDRLPRDQGGKELLDHNICQDRFLERIDTQDLDKFACPPLGFYLSAVKRDSVGPG